MPMGVTIGVVMSGGDVDGSRYVHCRWRGVVDGRRTNVVGPNVIGVLIADRSRGDDATGECRSDQDRSGEFDEAIHGFDRSGGRAQGDPEVVNADSKL